MYLTESVLLYIKSQRIRMGYSAYDVAKLLGYKSPQKGSLRINDFEQGKEVRGFNLKTIKKLLEILNIDRKKIKKLGKEEIKKKIVDFKKWKAVIVPNRLECWPMSVCCVSIKLPEEALYDRKNAVEFARKIGRRYRSGNLYIGRDEKIKILNGHIAEIKKMSFSFKPEFKKRFFRLMGNLTEEIW